MSTCPICDLPVSTETDLVRPDGGRAHTHADCLEGLSRTHTLLPNDLGPEQDVEAEEILALLLAQNIVFLNTHWNKKDWPEDARTSIRILVNCNDTFAWACADAEPVRKDQLLDLWSYVAKDPCYGQIVWCIIQRKQMPQEPMAKAIMKTGLWDLDALQHTHGLRPNFYDGVSTELAQQKYTLYSTWAAQQGQTPLPFDATWWEGWKAFVAATPDWQTQEVQDTEKAIIAKWQALYASPEEKTAST